MSKMKLFILSVFLMLLSGGTVCLHAQTDPSHFVITVDTGNRVSAVSSDSNSFTLPMSGGAYDVDWDNDGVFDDLGVTGSITHDFGADGVYTIQIRGGNRINFNNNAEREKIIDIVQWGTNTWSSFSTAFFGCSNLNSSATDSPDLSLATNFSSMFRGCANFNANIGGWDVSNVEDFSNMFSGASSFNNGGDPSIDGWVTTNVTNMIAMFQSATNFNQPIGNWITTNVTNMTSMFESAINFDQNIGNWNVSNVTNMSEMFIGARAFNNGGSPDIDNWRPGMVTNFKDTFNNARAFNQPIGNWDVSSAQTMHRMFSDASSFNQPIGGWDVSSVTDMTRMFLQSGFNQDIGSWNVTSVTNMNRMFFNNSNFNNGGSPNINNWRPSMVTDFGDMFNRAPNFNQPIGDWDTGSARKMDSMFELASDFDQDISDWNVTNVTTMAHMFFTARAFNNGGSPNINNWVPSMVTNFTDMFHEARVFNQPIGNWNVGSAVTMHGMFEDTSNFDQDIGSWNVTSVTNMSAMFHLARAFNNGGSPNINNWVPSMVTTFSDMFHEARLFNQPIGNWDVGSAQTMHSMFEEAFVFDQDIGSWNVTSVTDMSRMFLLAYAFNNGGSPNINNWVPSMVTTFEDTFHEARVFNQPIDNWDVGSALTMHSMFEEAFVFDQDIGSWNVTSVTNMSRMFHHAYAFNNGGSPDIDNWRPGMVTTFEDMFHTARLFNQPIGNWDVGSAQTMHGMLANTNVFDQNISAWDVGQVTDTSVMFANAIVFNNLGDPGINNWTTNLRTTIQSMFQGATSFNQDIGNWDVSGVSNMADFLHDATSFDHPLGAWDLNSLTSASGMLDDSGISLANWDATLFAWHAQNFLTPNVSIGARNLVFCAAVSVRYEMVDNSILRFANDVYCKSPGAIMPNVSYLWYDASFSVYEDSGLTDLAEDGDPIVSWVDSTKDIVTANLLAGSTSPVYKENTSNFNPGLKFNASTLEPELDIIVDDDDNYSVFIVFSSDTDQESQLFSVGERSTVDRREASYGVDTGDNLTTKVRGVVDYNDASGRDLDSNAPFITSYYYLPFTNGQTRHSTAINSSTIFTRNTTGSTNGLVLTSNNAHAIGSALDETLPFDGTIYELVVLPFQDTSNIRDIESYLALKYGVTLSGATENYQTATTLYWDVAVNNLFNHDIAGVFRDDNTALYQRISRSVNADAVVTISTADATPDFVSPNDSARTSINSDASGLVWGNNNGSLSFDGVGTNNTPFGLDVLNYKRLERIWFTQPSNFTDMVNIQFKDVSISSSENVIYYLVSETDGDGDFTNDGVIEHGGVPVYATDNAVSFENVDLNAKYFTLVRLTLFPMRHGKRFLHGAELKMKFAE